MLYSQIEHMAPQETLLTVDEQDPGGTHGDNPPGIPGSPVALRKPVEAQEFESLKQEPAKMPRSDE